MLARADSWLGVERGVGLLAELPREAGRAEAQPGGDRGGVVGEGGLRARLGHEDSLPN